MAFEGLGPAQQEQFGCIVVGVVCLWSVCRFYILYVWVCGMKDTGIPFTSCQPLYITSVNRCKKYIHVNQNKILSTHTPGVYQGHYLTITLSR